MGSELTVFRAFLPRNQEGILETAADENLFLIINGSEKQLSEIPLNAHRFKRNTELP